MWRFLICFLDIVIIAVTIVYSNVEVDIDLHG